MQYINLGEDARPSRLGFGCMRLPTTPEGEIDEPRAKAMIGRAIEAGVTYFDTAYFYHKRKCEEFLGRALKPYPRESFYLATKLPVAILKTLDEAKEIFEGQFAALQTDYFDFYLLHAINRKRFEFVVSTGILDFLIEQQRIGRIRHLGFSFHGEYEEFEEILHARHWDFCQIQFNYMDVDAQAGMRGYRLAESLGVPLVIMEPVKGGSLATLSDDIAARFLAERPEWSVASWAMRFVASLPNCRVILSGMSTEEQLEDNLATFESIEPLSEHDQQVIAQVRDAIRAKQFVGCTGCEYCMPCPYGVDIAENFAMMNRFTMYGGRERLVRTWKALEQEGRADACRRCGNCEAACPQRLPIRDKLAEIVAFMA